MLVSSSSSSLLLSVGVLVIAVNFLTETNAAARNGPLSKHVKRREDQNWRKNNTFIFQTSRCFNNIISDEFRGNKGFSRIREIYTSESYRLRNSVSLNETKCQEFQYLARRVKEAAERARTLQGKENQQKVQNVFDRGFKKCLDCESTTRPSSSSSSSLPPSESSRVSKDSERQNAVSSPVAPKAEVSTPPSQKASAGASPNAQTAPNAKASAAPSQNAETASNTKAPNEKAPNDKKTQVAPKPAS